MHNFIKVSFFILIAFWGNISNAQSRRASEIRSCLSSEMAYAILENADESKSWDENFEIGKKLGYVVTEYYQQAIWAMDNPEIEGREAVLYAFQSAQKRIKYMDKDMLRREVQRCRKSFSQ